MNWTGGDLQRHQKNAGSATLQRQKAHFAKIRAARQLHHQPQSSVHSDFRPSFFYQHVLTHGKTVTREPLSQPSRPAYPQHSKKPVSAGGPSQPQKREHSVINISSTSSISLPSDDGAGPPHTESSATGVKQTNDDSLERDRQRLLAQSDWLGLQLRTSRSRSQKASFASHGRLSHIAKRRCVNPRNRSRLDSCEGRLSSQPVRKLFMSGALPDAEIQVRIGPDAFLNGRISVPKSPQRFVEDRTHQRGPSETFDVTSDRSDAIIRWVGNHKRIQRHGGQPTVRWSRTPSFTVQTSSPLHAAISNKSTQDRRTSATKTHYEELPLYAAESSTDDHEQHGPPLMLAPAAAGHLSTEGSKHDPAPKAFGDDDVHLEGGGLGTLRKQTPRTRAPGITQRQPLHASAVGTQTRPSKQTSMSSDKKGSCPVTKDSSNDLWKRFVFGSNVSDAGSEDASPRSLGQSGEAVRELDDSSVMVCVTDSDA